MSSATIFYRLGGELTFIAERHPGDSIAAVFPYT